MIADERKRARDRELDVALLEQELTQLRASLKQVEDLKPNQKSIVDARSAQLVGGSAWVVVEWSGGTCTMIHQSWLT